MHHCVCPCESPLSTRNEGTFFSSLFSHNTIRYHIYMTHSVLLHPAGTYLTLKPKNADLHCRSGFPDLKSLDLHCQSSFSDLKSPDLHCRSGFSDLKNLDLHCRWGGDSEFISGPKGRPYVCSSSSRGSSQSCPARLGIYEKKPRLGRDVRRGSFISFCC